MSMQEFDEIINSISPEKWQEKLKPTAASYTEFEISLADSQRFLHTLENIIPQIYVSLQHQIKDPKTSHELRKDLSKRAMKLESTLTSGIDKVWKLSSKMTYEVMTNKMIHDRLKKKMVEKMKYE